MWRLYNSPGQFTQECAVMNIICLALLISLAGCVEPSVAHGLEGRRNVWLLTDSSRGQRISVGCLSLRLPLHSLRRTPLVLLLLSPGIAVLLSSWVSSEKGNCKPVLFCILPSPLPQILNLRCGQRQSEDSCRDPACTFFSSVGWVVTFLRSDFQWEV